MKICSSASRPRDPNPSQSWTIGPNRNGQRCFDLYRPLRACGLAPTIALFLLLFVAAGCSDSSSSNDLPTGPTVVVSGTVTFEQVPVSGSGFNFAAAFNAPARGVTVQAIFGGSQVLAETTTDEFGRYSLEVVENTDVFIRALAELFEDQGASWDVLCVDNTAGNAVFALDGADFNTGQGDWVRDLHAPSGWDGTAYTQPRAAAPFAILDAVYDAIQTVVFVDPTVILPPLDIHWSENNVPTSGSISAGQIGSSFYSSDGIFLLGAADIDTDEYDEDVVRHEWFHYFQFELSRNDSLGGSHNLHDPLDLRLALSEGFANAYAGISGEDELYVDVMGMGTGIPFGFNLETPSPGIAPVVGWFNELSVSVIAYDLFDANNEGSDGITLGFGPLYDTLLSLDFVEGSPLTTIFSFVAALKSLYPAQSTMINTPVQAEDIRAVDLDAFGSTETNAGGDPGSLPVYNSIGVNQSLTVCVNNLFGDTNRLGNRRFFVFSISAPGAYTLRLEGASGTNPDIFLYRGLDSWAATSNANGLEVLGLSLQPGTYIVEVFDRNLELSAPSTTVCLTLGLEG